MPDRSNGMQHSARMPVGKAGKCAHSLADFLAADSIEQAWLYKIIGRLSFAQSIIFGIFARALLAPLYREMETRDYNPRLSDLGRIVLRAWIFFGLSRPRR